MLHMAMIPLVPLVVAALAGLTMFFVVVLNTSAPHAQLRHSQSPIPGRNKFLRERETVHQSVRPLALPPTYSKDMLFDINYQIPTDNDMPEFMRQLKFKRATVPIKELVRDGIARGLIVIVNVSTKQEMENVNLVASQHRASSRSWDINGALDGSLGDLLAELMEEVHVVDELRNSLVPTIPNSYDVAVIKCVFDDPTGANGKGGDLYMKIHTNEFVPVFRQKPEEIYSIQFEGPLRYQYAYCSPLILDSGLNPEHLKEWFMYHHSLFHVRKTHYFIYHGIDLGAEVVKVLQPLLNNGLVTLIDVRLAGRSNLLAGQYPGQHLAMNDCLHRARYLADWVFFWSFEEYLWVAPPQTLPGLLDTYNNTPWISFGRMEWSGEYCCAQKEPLKNIVKTWAVDKLCFRMEQPTCGGNMAEHATMCSGSEGRRKWIANPRLVFAASLHLVLEPQHSGVVLDTSVARINHYSLKTSQIEDCKEVKMSVVNGSETPITGTWWKDTSIAKYTRAARKYASTSKIFNASFVNPSPTWPPDAPKNENYGTSLNSSDIGSLLADYNMK